MTKLYIGLRQRGINFAPSAFETAMVSFAHSEEDFSKTLAALEEIKF
jgi:glutamate-1-semialdehyde 2,1-aminomutase